MMQPFEDVLVLDLTHVLAGPFCTYQLAVLGADVIKVEPPGTPDMSRNFDPSTVDVGGNTSAFFAAQNANKRAIALNLKSVQGQDVLKRIATSADVLVENYRLGTLDALGLGYDALSALNSKLIYCSMTGFGHTGPKAHDPAYDNVIQAFSGLMAATGSSETSPVKVGPPVLDYGTGAQAAFAIAAALYERTRSGRGRKIDVAMLDAALMLMGSTVVETASKATPPKPSGNSHSANAGYGCYPTRDGLLMVGAYTVRQLRRLWESLGDSVRASALATASQYTACTQHEQDVKTLKRIFMTKSANEWEAQLNDAGVPAARVRTLDETLHHPQVTARAVVQSVSDDNNTYSVPVSAFGLARDEPLARTRPPKHGEHTDTVLSAHGFDEEAIAGLRARGVIA